MEGAAAVDFAEDAAAEIDGADDGGVDGSNLGGFRINPDGGAGVSEQVAGVIMRLVVWVRVQLEFFEDSSVANLA